MVLILVAVPPLARTPAVVHMVRQLVAVIVLVNRLHRIHRRAITATCTGPQLPPLHFPPPRLPTPSVHITRIAVSAGVGMVSSGKYSYS